MSSVTGLPESEENALASILEATDQTPPSADKVNVPAEEPTPTQTKPAGSLGAPVEDPTGEGIELEASQLEAIDKFTKLRGSSWKNELKTAWETGEYGGDVCSNLRNRLEQVKVLTAGEPKYIKNLAKAAGVTESVRLDERTQALKVLLPNVSWDGKSGPDAYEGHTEAVWLIIVSGDKTRGEGVLVNAPEFDSYKGIKNTNVVKYKSMVKGMRPIIFDKVEVAIGDEPKEEPGDAEPEITPEEEPEITPDEKPEGPPPELEPAPAGPGEFSIGSPEGEAVTRGGQGVGGPRQRTGGTDICICPECGERSSHARGTPCAETVCPKCETKMVGESEGKEPVSLEQAMNIAVDQGMNKAVESLVG